MDQLAKKATLKYKNFEPEEGPLRSTNKSNK